jgi:hypothetical protein
MNPYLYAEAVSFSNSPDVCLENDVSDILIRLAVSFTSFSQPLFCFFNSPARIDATPVLYEKSLEKYLKKSISLALSSVHCACIEKKTHNSATVSVFEDCHRCRNSSISSKNLSSQM